MRDLIGSYVEREQVEGVEVEFIKPSDFIAIVRDEGVGIQEELELTCLLKVIMKAELGGLILMEELIQLLGKFGVP